MIEQVAGKFFKRVLCCSKPGTFFGDNPIRSVDIGGGSPFSCIFHFFVDFNERIGYRAIIHYIPLNALTRFVLPKNNEWLLSKVSKNIEN